MIDRVPRAARAALRRPFPVISVLVALGFAALGLAPATAAAGGPPLTTPNSCKPRPPVDVQIVALDGSAPAGIGRFRLDVTPRIPAREVRVRWFRSSERLLWVSGDSLASRRVGLETSHSFQVALRVPDAGLETLHCQVEIVTESGQVWRRGAGVALGPESVRSRGRSVPDGEGGHVVEFDAAPAVLQPEGSR